MFSKDIFTKVKTRTASWVAIGAVLLAAFMPLVSNALAARASQSAWQEICSIQGIKYIPAASLAQAVTENQAPQQDGRILHVEHCPYCSMHAGSVGLVHTTALLFAAVDNNRNPPQLYSFSPQTSLPWAASRSRAPPEFS